MIKSFFERQSPEIQELMAEMAGTYTTFEIIEALKEKGVIANRYSIHYYRYKNGIKMNRYDVIKPEKEFNDRIWQYIEAIPSYHGDTWANKNIGCKSQAWTSVTRLLVSNNLIEPIGRRPIRYSMIVPHNEIVKWYKKFISNQTKGE